MYPAGYTVEDVLNTAFAPLHEMEEEMDRLTGEMGNGGDQALMARYDKLSAAFEAGGGYGQETNKNKVCSGLSISASMRQQLFDQLLQGGRRPG